uniref:Uncharacterized protein n=1 Tax=uncultured marine virus TaxID=186617 RepID=A0A0F7L402_9VIRU|nr:hypothetical protein [uncultured marine virus]
MPAPDAAELPVQGEPDHVSALEGADHVVGDFCVVRVRLRRRAFHRSLSFSRRCWCRRPCRRRLVGCG